MDISSMSLVVPTGFNDLPLEIIDQIFSHLGVRDVGRCMMVSKRWNTICNDLKIKELILKGKFHKIYDEWSTKELFDQNMVISNLYVSIPLPLNTTFLKRLAIYGDESNNFQLLHINKFVHLQHLDLHNINQLTERAITFLNLPNLKILSCSLIYCNVVFNAPALTTVYMSGSTKVRFRNLPTLKLLDIDSLNDHEWPRFNRIKSVEVFRMHYNQNFHIIPNVLANLNLKEVRCDYYSLANAICREYFQEWVATILDERRILNKRNVKIFIFDILLEDDKAFDEYGFENVDRMHIY